jgi:hypothetical protein
MKVLTAEWWVPEFYNQYYDDAEILRLCKNREQIESKWTQATLKVSGEMGTSHGCKVTSEESTAGGGRSDQRWVRNKASVAFIEHENRSEDLSSELAKLCNDVSGLKVLLTYVADRGFPANIERIKKQVGEAITDHIGSFVGELLLMVSGYKEEDWMAYSFVVKSGKFNIRSIRLPKD